jgi:DnaJ-class molecular chaperone
MDFYDRKKIRTEYYFKFVYKWKLKECVACNGSGWYDSCDKYGDSIPCGACEGTGKERYKPSEEK